MTLLAGVVALRQDAFVPERIVQSLRSGLSRSGFGDASEFRTGNAFLTKLDIGAYGMPAYCAVPGVAVTALAGHPYLLGNGVVVEDADRGVATLHDRLLEGDVNSLQMARGVFAVAHYEHRSHRLILATDKMGVRPIYVASVPGLVIFSTALRIIEAVPEIARSMDVQAVLELAAFSFPLGERTPYDNVKVLRQAEVWTVQGGSIDRTSYHDWADVRAASGALEDWVERAHQAFQGAVEVRAQADRTVMATISGGMDSRTIVSLLREQDRQVHAINFSTIGSVDEYCAHGFARNAGCMLYTDPREPNQVRDWFALLGRQLRQQGNFTPQAERPRLIWSGDGGSVGVGAVYLNAKMVGLAREGDIATAIDSYLAFNKIGPPTAALESDFRKSVPARIHTAVASELAYSKVEDQGAALHLFLMFNDQRRHLSRFYEDIDLNRFEYHLPFFDSAFLEVMLSIPLDARLNHQFYTAWFDRLPRVVRSVPWQTYPGHVACPLPIPSGLARQWTREPMSTRARIRQKLALAREQFGLLLRRDFPSPLVSRKRLLAGVIATASGLRDVDHVFTAPRYFCDYWRRCEGRWAAK